MEKRNNLIFLIFNLFIAIIIFDIFFRGLNPRIGTFLNLIKVAIPILLMVLGAPLLDKKKFSKLEKSIFIFFILFYSIFLIKIISFNNNNEFYNWLSSNNNINFLYVLIFYLSMRKIDMHIYLSESFLKSINFIVLTISIYGFFTGNYFGTVDQETLLNYAWVGTNKSRMMGVFGNPNHAGLYFVSILFILDYFNIKENKKFFNLTNLLLCVFNILTFSRTSIIIMIIYFLIRNKIAGYEGSSSGILKILNKYKIMIILVIFTSTSIYFIKNYNIYFFSLKYLLTTTRTAKWLIGLNYMMQYPILGTPFNVEMIDFTQEFGILKFSDNFIIELGGQFGIVVMFFVLCIIIYYLFKSFKDKNFFNINKIQLFLISSILSGTIHFSISMFLCLVYFMFKENKELVEGKQ